LIGRHGTSTYDTFKKMGVPYRPVSIPYVGNALEILTTVSVGFLLYWSHQLQYTSELYNTVFVH